MPTVSCPTCGQRHEVADTQLGVSIQCSDCARAFVAEKPAAARSPSADLAFADRPAGEGKSRRRSEWVEAHRGGMIMAMGIVSILIGGIGLVTGILAWVWGNEDLKKMDAGIMDPEGRSNTQLGKVLGMVGTILHAFGLIIGLLSVCLFVLIPLVFVASAVSVMPTNMTAVPQSGKAPQKSAPSQSTPSKKEKKKTTYLIPQRTVDYLPPRMA